MSKLVPIFIFDCRHCNTQFEVIKEPVKGDGEKAIHKCMKCNLWCQSTHSFYTMISSDTSLAASKTKSPIKCTCGNSAIKSNFHSDWCDMVLKPKSTVKSDDPFGFELLDLEFDESDELTKPLEDPIK